MKIITKNEVIDFSDFKPRAEREYNYDKRCSICNAPYMKNNLLPEEMINILGDKKRYIPSCNCHEKIMERKAVPFFLKVRAEENLLLINLQNIFYKK